MTEPLSVSQMSVALHVARSSGWVVAPKLACDDCWSARLEAAGGPEVVRTLPANELVTVECESCGGSGEFWPSYVLDPLRPVLAAFARDVLAVAASPDPDSSSDTDSSAGAAAAVRSVDDHLGVLLDTLARGLVRAELPPEGVAHHHHHDYVVSLVVGAGSSCSECSAVREGRDTSDGRPRWSNVYEYGPPCVCGEPLVTEDENPASGRVVPWVSPERQAAQVEAARLVEEFLW